jgi:thiamine pyrophosphokinase
MQALIFANGDVNDGAMVQRAISLAQDPLVIAADGGARVSLYFNHLPRVVIGDFDSLSAEEVETLMARGVTLERYPSEKDETDLELALRYAVAHDANWICIVGGLGNRLDQTLANLYLMALPELIGREVIMVAGKQEIRLLRPGEYELHGAQGDTISLIPVGGAVYGIRTENLYYPLHEETLHFGPARGVSNVMKGDIAQVSLKEGTLLLVHTVGRA